MKIQIFSILILALILGMPSLAEASKKKAQGVFTVVKGKVTIQRDGKKRARKVRVGTKVYPKDTITSEKDSRAKIIMVDENILNISPASKVQIAEYENDPKSNKKKVIMNLMYGKVRSTVKQKYDGEKKVFRVKTPSAVAGVRGTDFFVNFSQRTRQSQVVTFEGQVTVGNGINAAGRIVNAVAVNPGQFTISSPTEAPRPPAILPENQLVSLDQESNADFSNEGTDSNNNAPREPANNKDDNVDQESNDSPPNSEPDSSNNDKPGDKPQARDERTGADSPRDPKQNLNNNEGQNQAVAGDGPPMNSDSSPSLGPDGANDGGGFAGTSPEGDRTPAASNIGPNDSNFLAPPPGDMDPGLVGGGDFLGPEPIGEFDQYQPIDPVFSDPSLTDGFYDNDQINDNIQNATRLIIEIRQ